MFKSNSCMPRSISRAMFCVLALGLVAVASACSGSTGPVTPKPTAVQSQGGGVPVKSAGRGAGGTLQMLHPQAPTVLNPHLSVSLKDFEPTRMTYEPLATVDKNGTMIPLLAAEIPTVQNGGLAADGKSVTWKLKKDIKWSDGQPFSAEDVAFTYKFITNPQVKAATASWYSDVASVQAIDAYTAKVNFKDVTPAWSSVFVGLAGSILPRHVFDLYNGPNIQSAPANTLPVGTGPYRVVPPGIKPQEVLLLGTQLVRTNKIVFEPNPYFRELDKPYFSRVEVRGGGTFDEAARLVMQDGAVDYAYNLDKLSPEKLRELNTTDKGVVITNYGSRVERILLNRTDPNRETADGERSNLNLANPFFSDKTVRQAFALAINRAAIAALYGPIARPTLNNLVIPPDYKYDNVPTSNYAFDLTKAKDLLTQAGWVDSNGDGVREKNGVKMKVTFQSSTAIPQESRKIVQDGLAAVGVEVVLKQTDPSILLGSGLTNPDSEYRFNADMMEIAIRSAGTDPGSYMKFWTCDQIPQKSNNWVGLNIERWCNSQYDVLYKKATTETDPEKRRQFFAQMNDQLIEDVVMIPMVYLAEAHGVSQTLQGMDLTPWDANTWNIKDWRRVSR